jgi:Lipocalin-like domain
MRKDQPQIAGVWKLETWIHEDVETHERRAVFGKNPKGCLVLTSSGRAFAILTGEGRQPPRTGDDKIEAFGSMVAYSGRYHLDADMMITRVDVAWDESQVGTDQVRYCRIEGDRLKIETAPFVSPRFGGRMVRSFLTWQRETPEAP